MPEPLGHCPNCNRPVFAGQRRCFCGFDLKALQAQWAEAAKHAQEAAAEQERAAAERAEHQRAAAAEAERQRIAAAEAERQHAEDEAKRARDTEAERQRAEAEARHARDAEAERQRLAAQAAERQRAEDDARRARDAEAERQRIAAREAERQRAEAEARRARDAEAERQRIAAQEAERQRAEAEAEHRRLADLEAQRNPRRGDSSDSAGNRRRLLQFGGGAAALLLAVALGLWMLRPSPPPPTPGGRGLPLQDATGARRGLLLGLAQPAPNGPVPYAIVSTGPQAPAQQHPLAALRLRPGAAETQLSQAELAQLPAATGAPDRGFDLAAFVAERPPASRVQERGEQRAAMGDWATARMLLGWAAEELPQARTALAGLYDPGLASRFATPFPPDAARAQALYAQAAQAGDAEATHRLEALRASLREPDRPTPGPVLPDRITPDRPPPPERGPTAENAARATLAKGMVLGVEIGRAVHRLDALRLLSTGVERESIGDRSLGTNLGQLRTAMAAAEAALDQQLAAFAATVEELRPTPAATLQAAAQAVRADPAYGGPANAHALDTLLDLLRQHRLPPREALLRNLASPP